MTASASAPAASVAAGLVVEDDPDCRDWLARQLREAFGDIPVTTVAAVTPARDWLRTGWSRRTAAAGANPGTLVALIDLGLPDGTGIEVIGEIARGIPDAIAVVTTIYDDDGHLFDAIAAGAAGYLLKDCPGGVLTDYLRRIRNGEPPLSPSIARRILGSFRAAPAPAATAVELTPREREVLSLLGRGLRSTEAARVLKVSEHTVATHVKAIYAKLNISSRAEAALEARNLGLV